MYVALYLFFTIITLVPPLPRRHSHSQAVGAGYPALLYIVCVGMYG